MIAEDTPGSDAEVGALLDAMGVDAQAERSKRDLFIALHMRYPHIPEAFLLEMNEQLTKDELYRHLVPIYLRQLTAADIAALRSFSRTKSGRRALEALMNANADMKAANDRFWQSVVQRVLASAKQRGHFI